MRCLADLNRSFPLPRIIVCAALAATTAGCSGDSTRLFDNPFGSFESPFGGGSGARPAQPEVTGSVYPKTSSTVQSSALPPPGGAPQPYAQPYAQPDPSMGGGPRTTASYQPTPITPPAQTGRAGGNGAGFMVTVAPGENAQTLARRYGVTPQAILQANNLPDAGAVKPGQQLVIPRYDNVATNSVGASRRTAAPSAPARPGAQHVHVVAPGETLMSLSRRYSKPLGAIAKANNIPPHTHVKVGDRIVIPGVATKSMAATAAAPPAPLKPQPVQPLKPTAPPAAAPVAAPPPASVPLQAPVSVASAPVTNTVRMVSPAAENPAPEKSAKADVTAAVPTFRWPVKGRVIAAFGARPSGQHNDGINVAVPEGTPIKAAEDGVVAYAGNELKTYGNLVLIRHSNGYVTAYAHASEIMVKRDEQVKRGQVIGKAGQTGTVSGPQVHFEIRKGSSPVDPMPFLDKGGNS